MKARIAAEQVRAEGRSVNEQAPVPVGTLAAPAPLTFVLTEQLPSGKNQQRTAWSANKNNPGRMKPHKYPDKRFSAWRENALREIGNVERPFVGSVHLIVNYRPGDRRTRDAPGMIDALCHLLVKAGVLLDDKQVKSIDWREWAAQPKFPRCLISIRDLYLDKQKVS